MPALRAVCLWLVVATTAAARKHPDRHHEGFLRLEDLRRFAAVNAFEGTVEFKLREDTAKHLHADHVAQVVRAVGGASHRRIFRQSGKHEERHQAFGLDRWYSVSLGDAVSGLSPLEESMEVARRVEIVMKTDLPTRLLAHLAPRPRARLLDDTSTYVPDDPFLSAQTHYDAIGLYEAWAVTTGNSDVVVQVIDSGMDEDHVDLQLNKWVNSGETDCDDGVDNDGNGYVDDCQGYNFADDTSDLDGDGSHGIHCAGTVAADSDNDLGVAGVAGGRSSSPGASLMIGTCFGNTATNGFDDALVYGADNGAHISSNSWGYTTEGVFSSAVLTAIDYATDAGVLVVFAAGNQNDDGAWYPAFYDETIAVAAVNNDGVRASFSNYGDWIEISAPGVSVLSTVDTTEGLYDYLSGTSMACPHVAGILALGISYAQDLGFPLTGAGAEAAENCLYSTATDIDGLNAGFEGELGAGMADVPSMLQCIEELTPTGFPTATPAPSFTFRPTSFPTPQPTPKPTTACGSCEHKLTLNLTTDTYPSETSWTVTESDTDVGGCDVEVYETGDSYTTSNSEYYIVISKEICEGMTYSFILTDDFGDGICCAFGTGGYVLSLNDEIVAEGGRFNFTSWTTFSVDTGSSGGGGGDDDDDTAVVASVTVIILVLFFSGLAFFYFRSKSNKEAATSGNAMSHPTPASSQQGAGSSVYAQQQQQPGAATASVPAWAATTTVAAIPVKTLDMPRVYPQAAATNAPGGTTATSVSGSQIRMVENPRSSITATPVPRISTGPAALPPNWEAVPANDGTGDVYYWNEVTNETQWDRPAPAAPVPPPKPPKPPKPARPGVR